MPEKGIRCLPSRVVVALLCATGVMELYISRINISIAIVAMVQIVSSGDLASNYSIQQEPYCLRENQFTLPDKYLFTNNSSQLTLFENVTENSNSEEIVESPKIRMTSLQRGNVLSAFFYAYGLSGMIGGRLAEIYGTKKVFGLAVFMDAVGNFLIPFAAKKSYIFLFLIRFTMGIFQGGCYPSLHALSSKWVPAHEHPTFIAFVFPANCFGTIFALTVCGLIISKWGWEASFYVSGVISLVWLTFWLFLIYDSPAQHPRISQKEKEYILNSKSNIGQKPKKVPILKILLSRHVWAICAAHAGNMLGVSFLLTQLPIYMNSILGVNIRNSGFLSALPFLARYSFGNAVSWTVKYIMIKKWVEKKTMRRIITTMGFGGPAVALILVGYVGCNTPAVMALFVFGMAFNGCNLSGYSCNHLELTSNFTGTSAGFASTIGFLYAMIGPVLVGALTPEETLSEWQMVYWLVFANYVIAGTTYCIFLSVDRQPWDSVIKDEEQLEELNHEKLLPQIENDTQTDKT